MMSAYRKFSDGLCGKEPSAEKPAKAAKPANADLVSAGTLAELAALACSTVEIDFSTECAEPLVPIGTGGAGIWGRAQQKRVGMVENDGGAPRDWVEGFFRLDSDCAPADVPPNRWQTFVDDVSRFLQGNWAEKAATLGWGPYDLFGCDRGRPFARIDQAGLLWLLKGNRLVALSENTATIETRTCARQTYRRRPKEGVLPWQLPGVAHK